MKSSLTRGLAKTKTFNSYILAREKIENKKVRKLLTLFYFPIGLIASFLNRKVKDPDRKYKYDLSIVLIVKNEGKYIQEWIEYYKILGFSRFYIFDNDSTDDTKQKLKKYIDHGLVDYNVIHGKARQMDAYNLALKKSKIESKYLAIMDADEFIFLTQPHKKLIDEINGLFNQSESIGGIGLNWMIFGSSHFKKQPKGLVTQSYLYRSKYSFAKNNTIKTICNPRAVVGILNPHYVEYRKGYHAVNALGDYMEGPSTCNSSKMIMRVNHYFTKSKEEFMQKRARGMADQDKIRNISDFKLHDRNDVFDDSMLRYKDELDKNLEND
ncbi:glycosyltransferase family 2 protein [Lactobacillus helveticus]|uniref:glycosyltransferase family 2 protein n=2 Tax=Lactobacillus helveticus TaxID=1587 RepID=UPI001561B074|nr:glycosyltransferase family 2 protein [Lactobacillus helveticus]NRO08907.1 hypothetical protein [Lactobacillus helveticus]